MIKLFMRIFTMFALFYASNNRHIANLYLVFLKDLLMDLSLSVLELPSLVYIKANLKTWKKNRCSKSYCQSVCNCKHFISYLTGNRLVHKYYIDSSNMVANILKIKTVNGDCVNLLLSLIRLTPTMIQHCFLWKRIISLWHLSRYLRTLLIYRWGQMRFSCKAVYML